MKNCEAMVYIPLEEYTELKNNADAWKELTEGCIDKVKNIVLIDHDYRWRFDLVDGWKVNIQLLSYPEVEERLKQEVTDATTERNEFALEVEKLEKRLVNISRMTPREFRKLKKKIKKDSIIDVTTIGT